VNSILVIFHVDEDLLLVHPAYVLAAPRMRLFVELIPFQFLLEFMSLCVVPFICLVYNKIYGVEWNK
jgi:hypothetical protein